MSLVDEVRHDVLFVTEKRLRQLGACEGAREQFAEQFPKGVEISVEICEANADSYDWYWAGKNFLKGYDRNDFEDAYNQVSRKFNQARQNLDSLYYDSSLLSEEEYNRLFEQNTTNRNKEIARLFARNMINMAAVVANLLVRRLQDLNNDELRYKVLFVTPERLIEAGACMTAVEMFRQQFGDGAEITRELALVHRNDYDWNTGAELLLNEEAKTKFRSMNDAAVAAFSATQKTAWNRYQAREISMWQERGIHKLATDTLRGDQAVAFATCAIEQYETLKAELAATKEESVSDENKEAPTEAVNELPTEEKVSEENNSEEDENIQPDMDW